MNANNHALLNRYQPPGSEKSMPVILNEGAYDAWLTARTDKAKEFLRQYPAQSLLANPVEKKADKAPKGWLDRALTRCARLRQAQPERSLWHRTHSGLTQHPRMPFSPRRLFASAA